MPVGRLWGLLTTCRRFFYQSGFIPRYNPPIEVITIGNLRLGGTGKTPLVEYLYRQLSNEGRKIAILSRGYRRKTQGYLKVGPSSKVSEVGDEAIQLFHKLGEYASIQVCEKRTDGIRRILKNEPFINLILLDDAFQHLSVQPSLNLLLTSYDQPFYRDHAVPAGGLREPRSAAKNADMIIVTKCPSSIKRNQVSICRAEIERYCRNKPVIFSQLKYLEPQPYSIHQSMGSEIVLVTGIAYSEPLTDYVSQKYQLHYHFNFADHHNYSQSDVEKIIGFCQEQQCSLLTTSKDIVKLSAFEALKTVPVFVQPIEIEFLFDGQNVLKEMITANQ